VSLFDGLAPADSVLAVRHIESKKTEKDGKTAECSNFAFDFLRVAKFGDHSAFLSFSVLVGAA
jgi:hypothetical protein